MALLRWHAARAGVVIPVSSLGKAKTGAQMSAIVLLMLVPTPAPRWVDGVLLVVVGAHRRLRPPVRARLRAPAGDGPGRRGGSRYAVPARPRSPGPRAHRAARTCACSSTRRVSRLRDGVVEAVDARAGAGVLRLRRPHGGARATRPSSPARPPRTGCDVVAALGGDGTVSQAASGLVGPPTAMACLPAGVTNVFARAIGTPRDPLAAAAGCAERERAGPLVVRSVDVGTVNGHHFLYTAGVGFTAAMAETAERAPDRKASLGQLHFAAAGIAEIVRRYLRNPPRDARPGRRLRRARA